MRSLLFVPADSEKKLDKGLQSEADALILDLEDAVGLDRKPAGRGLAAEFLKAQAERRQRLFVRVNDLSTGMTDQDLGAVIAGRPDAILLPKCNSPADVMQLAVKLRVHEADAGLDDGATSILALITETATGVLNASGYRDCGPRLTGLTWGAEDLSADIGARANRTEDGRYTDVFRLARAITLLVASAARVAAIDTVYPNFRDEAGFRRDSAEGERDGFTGRMAIHPAQVPVINEVFTPSAEAIEKSRAIIAAFAEAGNPGVVAIDGAMYDRPHLRQAERTLARAASAGRP